MIPYQMLRRDPGKALLESGSFPQTTFGHFERNYARMQGAHRQQDLTANLRRNDAEMLKQLVNDTPTRSHRTREETDLQRAGKLNPGRPGQDRVPKQDGNH